VATATLRHVVDEVVAGVRGYHRQEPADATAQQQQQQQQWTWMMRHGCRQLRLGAAAPEAPSVASWRSALPLA
jgi:hypothetical protein